MPELCLQVASEAPAWAGHSAGCWGWDPTMEVGTPMGDSALRPIALPGLLECLLLPPCPKTHFASSADELSHTLRVKCARWLGKHFLLFKDSWVLVLEITQRFPPFFFVVRSHHVVGLFSITINSATAPGSFHQHCNFPGLRHGESKSQCLEEGA